MLQTRVDSGLDGVIVADTVMSEVDGEAGRLDGTGSCHRGIWLRTRGFEGVAALLWDGYAQPAAATSKLFAMKVSRRAA